jgi:prepilin-type N-terminal cleavage/methylation domain-containing protein
MRPKSIFNHKGVTLIELLVALVIAAVVIASIYRLFVVQTRAYTVQDQVTEVQQTVRNAMEILIRDLRMTGYDDYNTASTVTIATPILTPVQDSDITVSYENANQVNTVHYWFDAANSRLMQQRTVAAVAGPQEVLLNDVNAFTLTYGTDIDEDGVVDHWVGAGAVGIEKVIAVRVILTARPDQTNPDVAKMVSPRTLTSAIMFRNRISR